MKEISPEQASLWGTIFLIIGIVVVIITFIASFNLGGFTGILAIILAYIGGYLIITNGFGVVLLFIALILGYIAPESV